MKGRRHGWEPSEIRRLPDEMKKWEAGEVSKAAVKEMFKNRTFAAVKAKYNYLLKHGGWAHANGHAVAAAPAPRREPRTLRVVDEYNTIVTYREVLES